MDWSQGGDFSKSLLSLQLQLNTILEGVGGEEAATLMDTMGKLTNKEREIILPLVNRVIQRLLQENERLSSLEDAELKDFENALYESVLAAMNDSQDPKKKVTDAKHKFAIVNGGKPSGKPVRLSTLIDLAKAREARKLRQAAEKDIDE